jgi:hypothetical protein
MAECKSCKGTGQVEPFFNMKAFDPYGNAIHNWERIKSDTVGRAINSYCDKDGIVSFNIARAK